MPADDLELAFAARCTECEMAADSGDPEAAARFATKHEEHTGHEVVWTDVELPEGFPGCCYEVRCLSCMTFHREPTKTAAEDWAAEHERYTDHEPDDVAAVDEDVLSEAAVNRLIAVLEEHFERGAPTSLVIESLAAHLDVDEPEARKTIDDLLIAGACYEPAADRIKAV